MNRFLHTIRTRALEHATEHAMVYVGIAIAASASVYAGTLDSSSENKATVSPRTAPIVETVSVQGMFSPSTAHEVISQKEGTISYIAVKQGDTVLAGDILVAYDMTDIYARRASLQRDLYAYEQAYQSLLLERNKKDVDVEIVQTQSRLQRVYKELARAEEDILHGYVRAPFAGTVQKVVVSTGDAVSAAEVLMVIQPTSAYEVGSVVIDKAKDVSVGNPANIVLASGKALPVTVVKKENASPGARITLVPQEDVSHIQQGDTARVEIVIAAREQTLTIPREYIAMLNDAYGEVRIKHGDAYVVRLVEIGAIGDDGHVEIISGLSKHDVVVK